MSISKMKVNPSRPTEEPYAGKPPVRFREGLGRQLPGLLVQFYRVVRGLACDLCLTLLAVLAVNAAPPSGYNLVWHDEFTTPSIDDGRGNAPWTYMTEADCADGGTLDFYAYDGYVGKNGMTLNAPLHVFTDSGTLIMSCIPTPCGKLSCVNGWPFISGGIMGTKYKVTDWSQDSARTNWFYRGYIEVRFREAVQAGQHPAISLYNFGQLQEVEICEMSGNRMSSQGADGIQDMRQAVTCGANSQGRYGGAGALYNVHPENWHVYGFLWDVDSVAFFFDGKEWGRWVDSGLFPYPMEMQSEMALELGGWCGIIDSTDILPMQQEWDYVRYYTKP